MDVTCEWEMTKTALLLAVVLLQVTITELNSAMPIAYVCKALVPASGC